MTHAQIQFSADELLADHDFEAPLFAGTVRCHGGFDAQGAYVPPRTKHRWPAIHAWEAEHARAFGKLALDVELAAWPEHYPNVAQARYLLGEGVAAPMVGSLTRIGTLEGFGAGIRFAAFNNLQNHVVEGVRGTATGHLGNGLYEAHARDEAGHEQQGGHQQMWFAARDIAFGKPVLGATIQGLLQRMMPGGPRVAGGGPPMLRTMGQAPTQGPPIEPLVRAQLMQMIGLLFIEVSAFHTFAWAEALLGDSKLVAGDGEAGKLVSYIRADEAPHVAYLKVTLNELRERTFRGTDGRLYPGREVVDPMWQQALAASLGPGREQNRRFQIENVESALEKHVRRDDILARFHALETVPQD
jgi:hypothetical protein